MQTSRFQLGLIATLAAGLGFSLASSDAVGYPAGAAVSYGSNPVWSIGGTINRDGTGDVTLSAPADQDMVVTDVFFNPVYGAGYLNFTAADGTRLAYLRAQDGSTGTDEGNLDLHFRSGIRVPAGTSVTVTSADSEYSYARPYTLSGYYAQP